MNAMAALEFTEVWSFIEQRIMLHKASETINEHEWDAVMDMLQRKEMTSILTPWFTHEYEKQLRREIIPEFWSCFRSAADLNLKDVRVAFTNAVTGLYTVIEKRLSSARFITSTQEKLGDMAEPRISLVDLVYDSLQAALKLSVPPEFNKVLLKFYSAAFRAFHRVAGEDDGSDSYECPGCELEADNCECTHLLEDFDGINKKLHDLRLLDAVVRDAVSAVAYKYIEQHIQNTCRGIFESRFLDSLEKWLTTTVMEWFRLLYKYDTGTETEGALKSLEDHLRHYLYDTYVMVRVDQLFSIIIEFPESQAALEDLKDCLERTNLRSKVIHSLKNSMEKRLLHPGVETTQILTAYISAIKALRVLDSTGYILHLVCEPVCKYLRTREDTVRSIVSNLTDESCTELEAELVKLTPIAVEDSCLSDDDDEDWQNWKPAPVGNEQAVQVSKGARSSDIVSMLVNIYGSKKLFASEYQVLLANRLLTGSFADTEREVRYLECLKLRFGESQLHACEVMLRDLADSRRLNSHLASGENPGYTAGDVDVSAIVISAQFWPPFKDEKLALPPPVQASLDRYTRAFEAIKGNRTLQWRPNLGQVTLEVDTGTRTLQLTVSPMHATLIYHFQEKARWTLDELSAVTQASATLVRRKLALWQGQGILFEESPGVFALGAPGDGAGGSGIPPQPLELDDDEEEAPSAMASTQDQKESDLQIYWSYIVGMLTNLESLTLERIHTMLKMFAMQTPSTAELTAPELRHFLDGQVSKQKLLYSAGHYRLPKSDSL
ncbi:anaphase promoting complex subunit morula isoform X2 [Amblyomma americanum]